MYDLIVVGGGFWGTAIAFKAQLQGLDVLLFDDNQSLAGSRNSSGIAHLSSYKANWIKNRWPKGWSQEDVEESFQWLTEHFGLVKEDEYFVNLFQDRPIRLRGSAYTIRDNKSFLSRMPKREERVHHIERYASMTSWAVVSGKSTVTHARSVVLAAGIWTNEILKNSRLPEIELSSVEGWGLQFRPAGKRSPLVTTYMTKPYIKYTARPWTKGLVRLGDTTERKGKPRYPQLEDLASNISPGFTDPEWVGGYRPTTPKFLVDSPLSGLVIATGGYRAGLGISGLVAKKALELIL